MLMTETDHILDDLLGRYHGWAKSYRANFQCPRDPVFRDVKSGRSWDSTADVIEDELVNSTMETVDFQIGEMPDTREQPYRSAIYQLARNCYTGRKVWLSPRLPNDPIERGVVIQEARNDITRRLIKAGVL